MNKPEPDYTKNIRANLKRWNLEKIGDCRVKSALTWLEEVCFRYDYLVKRNAKLQAKLDERKEENGKK